MGEKVVLPKFDLPGDRMHPTTKILLGAGVLLLVSLMVLGGAVWHRRSLQLAAEQRQAALIAARTAEANAAAEAAKARIAEAEAKKAAEQGKAAERLAAKNAPAPAAIADGGGKATAHKSSSRKSSSKSATKVVASKTDAKDEAKKSPGSKRDDAAIDKLLASFK
jgi:colicin import membrane protein